MQIAVLSDIHDHVWHLQAALEGLQGADALICCGDLCSPFVLGLLAEGFPARPIHIVFGNNDGDLYRITQQAARFEHVHLHGAFFEEELGGRRFAANHYPEVARAAAASGRYEVVCYGHDHRRNIEQLDGALLINPGAVMGYDPAGKKDIPATVALYDAAAHRARLLQVGGGSGL